MTTSDDRTIQDRFAAIDAAYERYIAQLRTLNRMRSRRDRKAVPDHAAQLADARRLVEEAYAQWFMLARPDLIAAQRAGGEDRRS